MMAAEHLNRQPFSDADLDQFYPWPRPALHAGERDRYYHLDLSEFGDLGLHREEFAVAHRLRHDWDAGRVAWLVERRDKIHAERRRRRDAERATTAGPDPAGIVWGRSTPAVPALPRRTAPPLIVRRRDGLAEL